jgi:glutathione gamma-glutamylcysteinyltransferase
MLKVNPVQWLRFRSHFQIPRSALEHKPILKAIRPAAIIKTQGRSIGTQTEHVDYKADMPVPNTAPTGAVTAAFKDLLGVTTPTTEDDLKNTFYQRELPTSLVRFASPEGKKLFREAMDDGHAEGFFPLTGNFTTQSEPAYCGPSSCK